MERSKAYSQLLAELGQEIEAIPDPNLEADVDRVIANMMAYILDGVPPIEEAPEVPADYWEKVQETAPRRMALAGYRIADIILATADRLLTERDLAGKVIEAMPRHH